jgi:hypothetical protein
MIEIHLHIDGTLDAKQVQHIKDILQEVARLNQWAARPPAPGVPPEPITGEEAAEYGKRIAELRAGKR